MNRIELLELFKEPLPVLDDGHVMLVDVMGDDKAIADAARVSYGIGTRRVSEDRHLLRYLMRNRHTSPFEMCEIKLRVRVPMDAWRHWIRHRTANVNEYSTRYSKAIDSAQSAGLWRSQSKDNKQGSMGLVESWPEGFCRPDSLNGKNPIGGWVQDQYYTDPGDYLTHREDQIHRDSRATYEERLQFGVAREVARKDLPLSTYTEAYWKIDLHNLFHFLSLRLDPHAQKEIRSYAEAITEIVKVWVPHSWEAFEDYRLHGMYLTRFDVKGISSVIQRLAEKCGMDPEAVLQEAIEGSGLPKGRELSDLTKKIQRLHS